MQAATLARREDRPSASSSPRQTASSSAPKTTKSLALQFTPLLSNPIATSGSSHSANALLQSAIRQCFTPRAPPSPRVSVIPVSPHSKACNAWPQPVTECRGQQEAAVEDRNRVGSGKRMAESVVLG